MAIGLTIKVEGIARLRRVLDAATPRKNPDRIISRAITEMLFLVQKEAAENAIIRGGKGPPHPSRLTSRTGTGRRSIRVDQTGLPRFGEVGSDLGYMALHEEGGRIVIGKHTRRHAFGRATQPFSVGPYSATYPARPWLRPSVTKVLPRFPKILVKHWKAAVARA